MLKIMGHHSDPSESDFGMNNLSLSVAINLVLLFASNLLPAGTLGPITYTDRGTSISIDDYSEEAEGPAMIPETIDGKPVTVIGAYAFMGCWNLTEIALPSGITRIEAYAFLRCADVTRLNIPAGVTLIGNGAFFGLEQLTSISLPAGVTEIGDYTFEGCRSLESVEIPSSITRIGSYAFSSCSSLASITIPSSVTRVDDYAFSDCDDFEEVTFTGNAPSMGVDVFIYGTVIYSSPGSKGFTYPKWLGYDSEFTPVPVLVVATSDERLLKNGKGKQQFGSVKVGQKSKAKIYAIVNVGNRELSGLTIIKSGVNKGDFKIVTSRRDSTLESREYVGLRVIFKPGGKGPRNATLDIRSNDPENPSFKIRLTGQGLPR